MDKQRFRELKKLERVVEVIDRDVDSVIVEGFSDKKVLERLGFTGRIFLSAERTVEDLVEDVGRASTRTVVLTDFDTHGKEANTEISQELQQEVDVVRSLRDDFGSQLTSTGRRAIEDINPLFDSLEDKFVEAALDGLFFKK